MRLKKVMLSALLIVVMLFNMMPVAVFAGEGNGTEFSDMPDNWSTAALKNAVANGLISGSDGKIMPDDNLTRAEMATVVVRAFGAAVKGDISKYSDVSSETWYADNIATAYQMGVIKGSNGKMNPEDAISRQEVFVILARAFKMQPANSIKKEFADSDKIADWAAGEVYAFINAGYIQGSEGKLNPEGLITRAEFAQIFNNIIKHYIKGAGEVTQVQSGNIMVNTPGVTLKNLTVNGDLIVGDGVGDGEVILDNVKIVGRMVVRGGGTNSIIIRGNSDVSNVVVARVDGAVSVKVQGDAKVEVIYVNDGSNDVKIEGSIGTVQVAAPDIVVTAVNANIKTLDVSAEKAKIVVDANSKVDTVSVQKSAANAGLEVAGTVTKVDVSAENSKVFIGENSKVETLSVQQSASNAGVEVKGTVATVTTSASGTLVTGSGSVAKVEAQNGATGAKIETPNTQIAVGAGVTGVTGGGGKAIESGTTANNDSSGSGVVTPSAPNGGGGSETIAVSSVAVSGQNGAASITAANGTLQMIAAVLPDNATNKTVTWTVINGTGKATISGGGLLTAVTNGTVRVRASANDGTGIYGEKEISLSGQPGVTISAASIGYSSIDPSVAVTLENDTFTAADMSELISNWESDSGTTGLSVYSITRDTDLRVIINLQGTAAVGELKLRAKAAALSKGAVSNEIKLIITPPVYNGAVSGRILTSDAGSVTGSLSGNYSLTVSGQVTSYINNRATFTGNVTGAIYGTISATINSNGIDTLSGTITVSDAAEPIRIIGTFPQSGTAGDFRGEIITGPLPTYVSSMSITGVNSITINDRTRLGVSSSPAGASAAWSLWVSEGDADTIATINQDGELTAVGAGTVTVIAKALDGSLKDATKTITVIERPASGIYNETNGNPCVDVVNAINTASDNDTIVLLEGTYGLTEQLNIAKPLTLKGVGAVTLKAAATTWPTVNGQKHLLSVYKGTVSETNKVTISNITLDSEGKAYGMHVYCSYANIKDLTLIKSIGAALTVNGSSVTAHNLSTSGNSWGAVNVDPGSGVITPSVFNLSGNGVLAEELQIWSDGANVGKAAATATVTVNAASYNEYAVSGASDRYRMWADALENVATITKAGKTTIYYTIQSAINSAANGDTINVMAGTYRENLVVNKTLTLIGEGPERTKIIATTGNNVPLIFSANNAVVSGLTLTHEYTQAEIDTWGFNNNGVTFGSGTTGNTLRNCVVTMNRNGIYLNNTQGNRIEDNEIINNRTGINMTNNVNNTYILNNTVSINWTIGIVYYDGSGSTDFSTLNVSRNNFNQNWYTEILIKDAPKSTGTLDVSDNTFTDSPITFSTSSDAALNEPAYGAQKPKVSGIGGASEKPAAELPTLRIYNSLNVVPSSSVSIKYNGTIINNKPVT